MMDSRLEDLYRRITRRPLGELSAPYYVDINEWVELSDAYKSWCKEMHRAPMTDEQIGTLNFIWAGIPVCASPPDAA